MNESSAYREQHRSVYWAAMQRIHKAYSLSETERKENSELLDRLISEAVYHRSEMTGIPVRSCERLFGSIVEVVTKGPRGWDLRLEEACDR